MPGAGLLALPPLPLSGVLFVLLTLSSITFDGFANTFFWLSRVGINPLDYPGPHGADGREYAGACSAPSSLLAAVFFGAVVRGLAVVGARALISPGSAGGWSIR